MQDSHRLTLDRVIAAAFAGLVGRVRAPFEAQWMSDERLIRLRREDACARCAVVLEAGVRGWWDGETKSVRCEACGPAAPPSPKPVPDVAAPLEPGVAGASAQREFERRRKSREDDLRRDHPHIGGLILALSNEPQSTTAWAQGSVGEERVGRRLDQLTKMGAVVLHDRRVPSTRANIDHLVVARSGVWVIDTKNYRAKIEVQRKVELRATGGWLRRNDRLFVGRRDRTKLVTGMVKQVEAVAFAIEDRNVPIYPVLCFAGADWTLFAKPFVVDDVLVTWPRALTKLISQRSGYDVAVSHVAARLATRLPVR